MAVSVMSPPEAETKKKILKNPTVFNMQDNGGLT